MEFARLSIPVVVSRFAHAFKFDPLRMIFSGTLAVTVPPERMEDVKHLGGGRDGVCVLQDADAVQCTEIRCEGDELARMWALYLWDG